MSGAPLAGASSRSAALAALALLVALAAPARAEDLKVAKLEPAKGSPGSLVLARGEGFPDKTDDVEVLVGAAKGTVTEAAADHVRFIVPSVAPGATTITFKAKGKSATAKFEVTPPDPKGHGGSDGTGFVGPGGKLLELTKVELSSDPAPKVVVAGTAKLPDFFKVSVRWAWERGGKSKDLATTTALVKGGRFEVVLGPFAGKTLVPGRFYVEASSVLSQQAQPDVARQKWSEAETKAHDNLWDRFYAEYGTPEQVKTHAVRLAAHYVAVLEKTQAAFDDLEKAYAAVGRCYHKKASSSAIDEEAWQAWVRARGLPKTGPDDLAKLKADARFLRGAFFNPEAWQTWLEKTYLAGVRAILDEHRRLRQDTLGPSDEEAFASGEGLAALLVRLAARDTNELHEWAKVEVPASLRAALGGFSFEREPRGLSRGDVEGYRRELSDVLERLARESATKPAPAASAAPPKANGPAPLAPKSR